MSITSAQRMRTQAWGGASGGGGSGRRAHLRPRTRPPSEGGDGFSLHRLPAAVCTCVWLPGRPTQPQSYAEHWDPALVRGGPLQLLHFPPVFLAVLPVPGSRGHRLSQLLHHRTHHSGRPLCEGPADPGAGHLLHLYPCWKVMPCLEAVALVLLIVLVPDPPRGAAEKQEEVAMGGPRSSWWEDVRYLGRNWSFVWSTLGVTAIAFVTGALGFWAPKFLFEARVVHGLQRPCLQEPCNSQDSLIFGALTVVTGIIGVVLGAEASRRYKKVNPRAEPLLCAGSLLVAAPCLYLALILAPTTFLASYVSAPGPRGAASVLQLGGGCRHPAVRGGAQVPGDSRGFADRSGPHPGGRQQPLPCWTGVQHPEGRAPRLLPAGLPQPPAEFPVLCICHCPGRGLLPADGAAPGVGPGPGPGAWHRDPGRRGHGEASPAFWRGRRHRGPLRPPPSCPPPCTPPAGHRSIRALSPSGCGSGPPAELHLSFLPSQPESWQGLWRELSCQRLRREAWACARPAPGPQPGWLPVGPE
ncbi:protein spinster homolog 3 isoform X2 [Panthera pardus]|uniref:Protein spinster homolog 3 isoform X2 n=1 Tax=Panthera pardus TaxID=9691 RepID=A0A9V1DX22_PANPR|nr:protein spinster homolog 3 isoform X2 [Panthera pardus]